MAKDTKPSFYFGAPSEVDDDNRIGSNSTSATNDLDIPLMDDDQDITDDVLETDEGIADIQSADEDEDQPKKKSKIAKKEVVEDDEDDEDESEEEETEKEDDEDEISSINLIAQDLIQKGVLIPNDESDYDDSDLGLAKLVEDTIEARLKDGLPEEYASILDAIKMGIPASEWASSIAPDEQLRNADLEDEDNQEILVARVAKLQGLSDDQIAKKIDKFKKLDILKDEAEEAHAILIKRDEAEKLTKNNEIVNSRKQAEEDHKKYIAKIYKDSEKLTEVEGVFINKKTAKEIADYATKPVNARGETQYMIDRNDPDILLKAAYIVKNLKNKTGVILKTAKSNANKSLMSKLDSKSDKLSSGKGATARETINRNRMSGGQPWDTVQEVED